jgi:uncharacterized protein YggE
MRNVLLGCLLLFPAGLSAQQQPEQFRTLTVSAQGTVERAPDQAVLMLAVESEASNARDAARTNAGKMDRVLSALRRAGISEDRIRTVGYDLQPVYVRQDQGEQPPRIAGYRALNRLQVTIDVLDRVGSALDAAIEAGANRAENLYFQLKDQSEARLEALRLATAKARREAEAVARAAGERLGVVQAIHTDSYAPPPRPVEVYARAVAMDAMKVETPVEAGNLSVTASVTIIYRLGG